MATIASSSPPTKAPIGTVVGLAIGLTALGFLILLWLNHNYLLRAHPRACLVYEESFSESEGDVESRARGFGHKLGRQRKVPVNKWFRKWKHPHAYCKECGEKDRRIRAMDARERDRKKRIKRENRRQAPHSYPQRVQPTYAPSKEYTRRWAQSGGHRGPGIEIWEESQETGEGWEGAEWSGAPRGAYAANSSTVRVPERAKPGYGRAVECRR
ncbi:MAG: hypothetical protein M1820_009156 [Bogoriella megaspora]|nr:MAG: hypothetical protein M1820_009156 [Bogoriella megaspora]